MPKNQDQVDQIRELEGKCLNLPTLEPTKFSRLKLDELRTEVVMVVVVCVEAYTHRGVRVIDFE